MTTLMDVCAGTGRYRGFFVFLTPLTSELPIDMAVELKECLLVS
jgi:hypothetical protein